MYSLLFSFGLRTNEPLNFFFGLIKIVLFTVHDCTLLNKKSFHISGAGKDLIPVKLEGVWFGGLSKLLQMKSLARSRTVEFERPSMELLTLM